MLDDIRTDVYHGITGILLEFQVHFTNYSAVFSGYVLKNSQIHAIWADVISVDDIMIDDIIVDDIRTDVYHGFTGILLEFQVHFTNHSAVFSKHVLKNSQIHSIWADVISVDDIMLDDIRTDVYRGFTEILPEFSGSFHKS